MILVSTHDDSHPPLRHSAGRLQRFPASIRRRHRHPDGGRQHGLPVRRSTRCVREQTVPIYQPRCSHLRSMVQVTTRTSGTQPNRPVPITTPSLHTAVRYTNNRRAPADRCACECTAEIPRYVKINTEYILEVLRSTAPHHCHTRNCTSIGGMSSSTNY